MIDRDTVIYLAGKHATCTSSQHKEFLHDELISFVSEISQMAAEYEREECARIAESEGHHWSGAPASGMFKIAEAIRARGTGGEG
ncbi:hypothetical protein [Comamonas sp. JNW]|jgi:hypothetical protein|uniref:hypothetical protein n=1 Tax=Comamonas sp. JNW TaxID=2170731 RepID=UPI000DE69798|nr:hypothetical protein [Comamonas sp. JNW]PWB21367.1 hypothetical protein DCO45_02925 [Comamonas sp. JNW]